MTTISISEKTYNEYDVHPSLRREKKIIIHDGWQWHMGNVNNEAQLKELLETLEIELTTIETEIEHETTGKIIFYNLSKNINNVSYSFWSIEQLKEITNNAPLKKVKGLSNGSVVDCYIHVKDNVIDVYRPNPNAKEVYNKIGLEEEIKFRMNNWYL